MQNIIRLPLDNAYNVRELGGYYTKDKQITQWHRFLRSDDIVLFAYPLYKDRKSTRLNSSHN